MTGLLLQHLITTTLLAALVWTVCRIAKPAPAAKHILWSLVMVKLLIPPMGEVGVAIPALPFATAKTIAEETPPNSNDAIMTVTESTHTARQAPRPPVETEVSMQWEGEAPAEPEVILSTSSTASTTPEPSAQTPTPTPIDWTVAAIAAWCLGALLMAALQLMRWQRFSAQTSVSANTPEWLQRDADAVAHDLDCAPAPVAVCKRLSTPAVTGVFRPRILVPQPLLERVPRERWRALLAHELAHVKRRDLWWRALELACGTVWFWNPVYWFARKEARAAAEHACDAWVVWALPEERRAYADALIDVSEWASTPVLPATAIGMSAANKAKLEARLMSIVTGHISRRTSGAMRLAAAILLAVSLPGWAIEAPPAEPRPVDAPKPPPAEPDAVPTKPVQPDVEAAPVAVPAAPKVTSPVDEELAQKLDLPVSLEFKEEHIRTILEYVSDYTGANIVLDYTVVGEMAAPGNRAEMDVVHVGPHWFRQPKREMLGSDQWPKTQVVDGMVGRIDGTFESAKQVLDAALENSGMTYAVTPHCVWITVARPQFEIRDAGLKPETWIWHPVSGGQYQSNEDVSRTASLFHLARAANEPIPIAVGEEGIYITDLIAMLREKLKLDIPPDDSRAQLMELPPLIVDAGAIAPPPEGPIPPYYLLPDDKEREQALHYATRGAVDGESTTTNPHSPVTSGMVPFIKLDNVPLKSALSALCRPLNLSYTAGPGFIYVSSQARLAAVEFADTPVPADMPEIKAQLEQPISVEFDNEHVSNVLEFISDYVGVNIVLDSRAAVPENAATRNAIGTNPVTDGMVTFVKLQDLRFADALKALLTPLGLDYSFGPGYIWISSPEFLATEWRAARAEPTRAPRVALPASVAPTPMRVEAPARPQAAPEPALPLVPEPGPEPMPASSLEPPAQPATPPVPRPAPAMPVENVANARKPGVAVMTEQQAGEARRTLKSLQSPVSIKFENEHVSVVLQAIADKCDVPIKIDPNAVRRKSDDDSVGGIDLETDPSIAALDGMVPFVHLQDVPLDRALEAILRPLGLDFVVQPGYVYVSTVAGLKDSLYCPVESAIALNAFENDHFLRTVKVNRIERDQDGDAVAVVEIGDILATFRQGQRHEDCMIAAISPAANQVLVHEDGMRYVFDLGPKPPELPSTEPKLPSVQVEPDRQPVPAPVTEALAEPAPVAAVEARPATVVPPIQNVPAIDGVKFRRITRWEDSDPRVELEFKNGDRKWYEIGDAFEEYQIADINVIDNQVTVIETGQSGAATARVLQLRGAVQPAAKPAPPSQRAEKSQQSEGYWTDYGGVRFGRVARWEDRKSPGGPWVQVEFPDGTRRWLGEGDAVGEMRLGEVNLDTGRVFVFKDGKVDVLELYRPAYAQREQSAPTPDAKPARRGPKVGDYEFSKITRWEENREPRVGVVHRGTLEWYEIGQSAGPVRIEDIDVIANQVVVNSGGEMRVLQLAWPVEESAQPAPPAKNVAKSQTKWTWTPIPYGGVKFGAIARWEDSRDGRVHVEFSDGTRKWLEEGDAIGNAWIGGINVVANSVTVRTPEGDTRTFDLPRPVQIAAAPSAQPSPPDESKLGEWTPVKLGNLTFGRIARWEENRDPRVQIELPGGERKWFEEGQTAAGVTIVSINVLRNRVTINRNGAEEHVQLPWKTTR